MKNKIAHIISPFIAPKGSEMSTVQPITFESMRRAKLYAVDQVDVELFSSQFPEDRSIVPEYFTATPDLQRSVLDVGELEGTRKLPLLKDILDALHSHSDADYFVFTNSDIGLMPQFYVAINDMINEGDDGFIINRRRISDKYNSIEQLDQMYSEVGEMHNGYDCFVFKRELYKKFNLGEVCVGIPHIGNTLAHNLFCWCNDFKLYTNKHLTFHIGMELVKKWGDDTYLKHNYNSFRAVLKTLVPDLKIANIPGAGHVFMKRHFKWLMNPTLHYPTLMRLDFKQWRSPRKKIPKKNTDRRYYEWLQRKVKLEE
ncbi:MAG: hypothetical protein ACJA1C_002837 [Crocinitomicaceae bacterium]|jgi:hypothetical protein